MGNSLIKTDGINRQGELNSKDRNHKNRAGLAVVVLGKGAKCLSPMGREFRPEKIGFLLEEREVKAKFRRGGGRTKGPKKRTLEDDQRFEVCLERILLRK